MPPDKINRDQAAGENFLKDNPFAMEKLEKFSITCPCCEAAIIIDAPTGAILAHEEKGKKTGSFEDLKNNLVKQKEQRENIFAQEMSSQKDRQRILEEKFQEALKRADTDSDKPFRNPLDLN